MNKMTLHFVYPKDETTDFLKSIIDHLVDNTEADIVEHRLETINQHIDFFAAVQTIIPTNAIVIFMGHGMSSALSGANYGEIKYGPYISDTQLSVFKNRKVVLLSCRSNEYLANFGTSSGLTAGIGFPNLITDDYELIYPEEPERVNGVTNTEINKFRECIVSIVKKSLEDFINSDLSFYQLYKRIQLRSYKQLLYFYSENPDKGKLPFGKMLYDLSHGISFIGN